MTEFKTAYLDEAEQQLLLRIARESLEHFLRSGDRLPLEGFPLTPRLRERHGAFVTLRLDGELRGCIGYTKSIEPLAKTVRDNAVNAGVRDPRFKPLTLAELDGVHIEISALCPGEAPDSPFIEVRELSEIVLGRDGIYLDQAGPKGGGLLLPQVPLEQGWNVEQFLEGLCRKANAPDRAWELPDSTLYRFSAQVFGE